MILRSLFRPRYILPAMALAVVGVVAVYSPAGSKTWFRQARSSSGIGALFDASADEAYEDTGLPVATAELRRNFPDNLYWRAVARPRDAGEREAQEKLHEHWATLYGKIYSGRAERAEIDEYYTDQLRLHGDQIRILQEIRDRYSDQMSPEKLKLVQAGLDEYAQRRSNVEAEYQRKLDQHTD